jgi:hypothetical protein
MKRILNLIHNHTEVVGRLYRIVFYSLCLIILFTAVIRIGGALNKKIGIGDLRIRLDHLLHALAYFIFSLYYLSGRFLKVCLFRKYEKITFFSIVFVIGILAEVLQIWVPYRSFSLLDLLSNIVGIGLGYLLTLINPDPEN